MNKNERNFLEASAEGAEAAIDLFVGSEAIESIPFVGTAVSGKPTALLT